MKPGSEPQLLRLLQISSSLCPIGAFAYSQGLESAVDRSWVRDEDSLVSWVVGIGSHGLCQLDLPLLARAYDAWQASDPVAAEDVSRRVLANRESRELLEQERHLGNAFSSVLLTLGERRAEDLRAADCPSYVASYSLGAVHFGIERRHAAHGYAYAWVEQQVNAAVRLVPLGHLAGQRCLSRVLEHVGDWVVQAAEITDEDIGSATLGLALASAWHETQYSRLFRS